MFITLHYLAFYNYHTHKAKDKKALSCGNVTPAIAVLCGKPKDFVALLPLLTLSSDSNHSTHLVMWQHYSLLWYSVTAPAVLFGYPFIYTKLWCMLFLSVTSDKCAFVSVCVCVLSYHKSLYCTKTLLPHIRLQVLAYHGGICHL